MNVIVNRSQGAAIMLDHAELAALKDELDAVAVLVRAAQVYGDVRRFSDLPILQRIAMEVDA
jgi:hypothetical protein